MTTQIALKSLCFAYFADEKFIGWYGDSFGSIRPLPKLYTDSFEQIEIITNNFRQKLADIGKASDFQKVPNSRALRLLDASINKDKDNLSQYKEVELRIVESPFYDGKNPDFDSVKYAKDLEEYKRLMTEAGIFEIPAPSKERTDAVQAFKEKFPYPKCDNWIYADSSKVKEWASKEPTKFITTIGA